MHRLADNGPERAHSSAIRTALEPSRFTAPTFAAADRSGAAAFFVVILLSSLGLWSMIVSLASRGLR